ncbi:MAG: hypothetical protein ACOY31_07100 [Bacillota bacterium]
MSEKNGGDDAGKKGNVFPLSNAGGMHRTRADGGDGGSGSLDDLVGHMRLLRDTIPVNESLRRELRQKLLGGGSPEVSPVSQPAAGELPRKGRNFYPGVLAALSVVVIIVFLAVFGSSREKKLETSHVSEAGRFWIEETPLQASAYSGDGPVVVERGGALLILGRQEAGTWVAAPPGGMEYSSPCWSPDGGKLALVRSSEKGSEVVCLDIPGGTKTSGLSRAIEQGLENPRVIAAGPPGRNFSGLSWSPDGKTIAYSVLENGVSSVFLAGESGDPYSPGPGARPAWSPDGRWLAVERDGPEKTLWLMEINGGRSYSLGQGRLPVWNREGYLLFVRDSIREKPLTYLPDGSPQFSVQRKTGEIRWLYLGDGGEVEKRLFLSDGSAVESSLLMTPDSPTGPEELQWLKRMEMEGVRAPRTLYLDRAGDYEGLAAGGGRELLLSRRDGDTVVLERIQLGESMVKREGGAL